MFCFARLGAHTLRTQGDQTRLVRTFGIPLEASLSSGTQRGPCLYGTRFHAPIVSGADGERIWES